MLVVDGLTTHPLSVGVEDLQALMPARLVDDFHCEEGWTKPDQKWSGYWLYDILQLAGPLPTAHFVEVAAGSFVTVLPLDDVAGRVLLATARNGQPLTAQDEGPFRLVVRGGVCYQSVKHVERLRLVGHDQGETARAIALARIDKA